MLNLHKDQLVDAFLIHRRAYRENDLLLDCFSKEYGMLRCVARGGRKAKRPIMPFTVLSISLYGKGELKTLGRWEVKQVLSHLTGDDLLLALYMNELLYRLLAPYDESVVLFAQYYAVISKLALSEKRQQHWLLRLFEKTLLAELGYDVDYGLDAEDNDIVAGKHYHFQEGVGFMMNSAGQFSGTMLHYLKQAKFDDYPDKVGLKQCRNLFRIRLDNLLGNKALKTKMLFMQKTK